MAQVAEILSEVIGKPVEHVNLSGEALSERLQSRGFPARIADFVAQLDVTKGSTGEGAKLNTVVKDVTGRDPVTFRAFAEANKQVWV